RPPGARRTSVELSRQSSSATRRGVFTQAMHQFCIECHGAALPDSRARNAWLGSFEPEHRLGTQECFVGRAGRIDLRPGDVAEFEIFLPARNSRTGVRSVAAAAADARNTSLEAGGEEQALERDP